MFTVEVNHVTVHLELSKEDVFFFYWLRLTGDISLFPFISNDSVKLKADSTDYTRT